MKKFGGEYGVILSIDVEMIKEKLPEGKCYLVSKFKNAKNILISYLMLKIKFRWNSVWLFLQSVIWIFNYRLCL